MTMVVRMFPERKFLVVISSFIIVLMFIFTFFSKIPWLFTCSSTVEMHLDGPIYGGFNPLFLSSTSFFR